MAELTNIPMPLTDPLIVLPKKNLKPGQPDPNAGKMNDVWIPYFTAQDQNFIGVPKQASTPVQLSAQAATIGSTPIPAGALTTGLYRITFYARITQAAPVSSSLIVSFAWTDGGVACGVSTSAITGNTTATTATGTLMINIDQATPVSYSTTYVSVGGPPNMEHSLFIILEGLGN